MPLLTETTISTSENASYGRVSGLVFHQLSLISVRVVLDVRLFSHS